MKNSFSESYAKAGVDVEAGYESVSRITPLVESTYTDGVLGSLGGFGGMFALPQGMREPVAVSGADGVGTKLKIAFLTGRHDTVGIDCVAMCVNDIVCSGARPLFFLDYIAMGKNFPARTERIVAGVAEGCRKAGCALIGGETAEMPGLYAEDEYDLAGFAVGVAERSGIIDGAGIAHGDAIIGLASSGAHSNGFSLIRKVLEAELDALDMPVPELGRSLVEELLIPTRVYVRPVLALIERFGKAIKGICHITGGGFYENVPRMLPEGVRALIDADSFPCPKIFGLISERGGIPRRDMYNTFNMGIGMALAVPGELAGTVVCFLNGLGERAYIIGRLEKGGKGVEIKWRAK